MSRLLPFRAAAPAPTAPQRNAPVLVPADNRPLNEAPFDLSTLAVRSEQAREVAQAAPFAICAGLFVASLVVIELREKVDTRQLLGWIGAMVAVVGFRLWLCAQMRRASSRHMVMPHCFPLLIASTVALACVWLVPSLFWYERLDPPSQASIALVYIGLISGSARGLGIVPRAALSFVTIIGCGLMWLTARHGDLILTIMAMILLLVQFHAIRTGGRLFANHVRSRQELEEQGQLIKLLREFQASGSQWLWEADAELRIRHISKTMADAIGHSLESSRGRDLRSLIDPEGQSELVSEGMRTLLRHFEQGEPFSDLAVPVARGQRWYCLSGRPVLDEKGRIAGWRGVGSDITDVRRGQGNEAARLARHDPLTGLANRLLVREMIEEARLRQCAGEGNCTLLLLDLDRFKLVNDTLGHAVGDRLLIDVARRLEETCGPEAGIGRLGGDEFAVVWQGSDDTLTLLDLAERIVEAVESGFTIGPSAIRVGVSIGIARAPTDGETQEQLMRGADLALYRAKENKRGQHSFYEPWMLAKAQAERLLENDVREAVEQGDLRLHYQPIVDARTHRLTGYEALLRWWHAERGAIGPDVFVPIIEDAGLIHRIGAWVIEQACREAATWPDDLKIAVNVSVAQLSGTDLCETVERALADSGLAADRLELEVNESVCLGEEAVTLGALGGLQNLGVRLVLDDFGKGYSNFAYLSRACFAKIKIDQMFVRGAAAGQRDNLAIVQSILALARGLDLEITAEGIETVAQSELMVSLGCTQLQGFLFGKPAATVSLDQPDTAAKIIPIRRRA